MLCPEVCNFKAPESHVLTGKSSPHDPSDLKTIKNFLYNHLVSVVLPDTVQEPESLTKALDDLDFYKISNVKLSEFVTKDFIDNFIRSGSLYVLSVGTRIDCDNCAAVTPTGQLILSLNKSTYQTLGLEGVVSHFHVNTKGRYIVTIDLKAKNFQPGKPSYKKTKACLESLSHDVIVTWGPSSDDICPSSIANYFHSLHYRIDVCKIKQKSHIVYSVKMPDIQDDHHEEFAEWLGMVALEGNLKDGAPDGYVSTYETPEPCQDVGAVKVLQWRGFFTGARITRLYKLLSEYVKNPEKQWLAMYVQGFSDSVVAWQGEEHHFYTNGDNSYTLILSKNQTVSFIQKCSRKRYNNKRKGKPL